VLIPLVPITHDNGPTQFIKSSHLKASVDIDLEEIYSPLLTPGDIVIFDGRTLHQGAANNSNDERLVAYITFVADWYHDQTFTINHYLFPELQPQVNHDL
jgi:ectoine hydroxylase-related dioxygenase (phytanoyl-CoA dioxygenase family)